MIILLHTIVSLISLSMIISESNNAFLENQMMKTIEGVSSYLEKTVIDLNLKVRLLSGQDKVIEYTNSSLISLLNRELVIYWQSLYIDYISIYKGDILNLPNFTLDTDNIAIINDDISRVVSIGEEIPQNNLFINNLINALDGKTSSFITNADDSVMLVVISPISKKREVIAAMAIGILLDEDFIFSIENFFNSSIFFTSNRMNIRSNNVSTEMMNTVLNNVSPTSSSDKIFTVTEYIIGHIPTSEIGLNGGHFYCIYNTLSFKDKIRRYNFISIMISFITLSVAMLVGISLYRSTFTRPFQTLIRGINMISADNIFPPFDKPGNDEFGEVAETFNQMCIDLTVGKKEIERLSLYNSLILKNMKSGILTINMRGEIITINPSAYAIIRELKGIKISKLAIETLPLPLKELLDSVITGRKHVAGAELSISSDGVEKQIAVSTSQLISQEGAEIGIIAVIEDITIIKNLEDKLAISTRLAALGEMAAGVAHQIRNPLAVMKVSIEMLRDDIVYPENNKESEDLSEFILKEIDTLDSVVNNFLAFAKPNRGNISLERIKDIINFSIRSIPLDKYEGIKLIKNMDSNVGQYYLDRNLMVQAVTNILINAFQSSKKGDEITIHAFRDGQRLIIEIIDEGIGMSEETMTNVYNPFFTTRESGTGLGLSIVHRIIEDHNGTIELESKLGKGTTFRLIFQDEK